MLLLASVIFSVVVSPLVLSAPVAPLDVAALLQNGEQAQKLNAVFQNFKITDKCTTGAVACISNATAECVDARWELSACPRSQQCFVLPSVRERGTFVNCTSERSALSIIEATGATGGLTGDFNSTQTPGTEDNQGSGVPVENNSTASTTSSDIQISSSSSVAINTPAPVTVTVTVTLQSMPTPTPETRTLAPETRTLSPEEASIFLSSFTAAGGSITTISPSSASPSSSIQATALPASVTSVPQSATSAPSAAVTILLTAASVFPSAGVATSLGAPAAASALAASSGGYDYGY